MLQYLPLVSLSLIKHKSLKIISDNFGLKSAVKSSINLENGACFNSMDAVVSVRHNWKSTFRKCSRKLHISSRQIQYHLLLDKNSRSMYAVHTDGFCELNSSILLNVAIIDR